MRRSQQVTMSWRRKLKNNRPPEGWERIEEGIEDFEQQMKEAVNEEHEGKRKVEGTWKIHRVHWETNRFIYDLMYVRKVMSRDLVSAAAGGSSPHARIPASPPGHARPRRRSSTG